MKLLLSSFAAISYCSAASLGTGRLARRLPKSLWRLASFGVSTMRFSCSTIWSSRGLPATRYFR
jgi:hypothetical protein